MGFLGCFDLGWALGALRGLVQSESFKIPLGSRKDRVVPLTVRLILFDL